MKRPVLIAVLCLCASLVVMFVGFHDTQGSSPVKTHTIALLTQEDTGSFLLQLRYGAEAAASEAKDKLTMVTLNRNDPAGQIAELQTDGIAAILLYAGDDALVAAVTKACAADDVPLALLDRTAPETPCAASDDVLMGRLAAGQAQFLSATRILFLTGKDTAAGQRLQGAKDALGKTLAASINWADWADASSLPNDVRILADQNAVVIALTGEATLAAVHLREQGLLGVDNPIIGIDANPEDVTLLEQGLAAALVLPAPYTMGYRGCALAIAALEGGSVTSVMVEPRLITLSNLYSARNVSIAFPLLQ